MDRNNQIEPSDLTKVLIKKIHGGRKQDSKFWQSELAPYNPTFDKPLGLDEELTRSKTCRSFLKAIVLIILSVFVLVFLRPDLFSFLSYKNVYAKISNLFPKKDIPISKDFSIKPSVLPKAPKPSTPSQTQIAPKQYSPVSRSQPYPKQKQYNQHKSYPSSPAQTQPAPQKETLSPDLYKNIYEIVLLTGRKILTENAMVTDEKVSYQTESGDIVTVNRYEVKTMKRYKVKR